jgi:hypothetical protein
MVTTIEGIVSMTSMGRLWVIGNAKPIDKSDTGLH